MESNKKLKTSENELIFSTNENTNQLSPDDVEEPTLSDQTVARLKFLAIPEQLEWTNPACNAHIFPQLVGNDTQKFREYFSLLNLPFTRKMEDHHPLATYRRRSDEEKSVIHWGQRKLLLAEIEFLTLYGDLSRDVVYVGAAPGTHTSLLARMFPRHNFYLYDPAPFSGSLRGIRNVKLHQILFTDDVAEKWRDSKVLFISDIRSADPDIMEEDEVEENVQTDMTSQMRWCRTIRPVMCSLKFRLPWKDGKTEYFDGDVYYQLWGPPTTTETRLFSDCKRMKRYNNREYEQKLFYFNTVNRLALYDHDYVPAEGLDHCYDCTAELVVLTQYFKKFPHMLSILYRPLSPSHSSFPPNSYSKHSHHHLPPSPDNPPISPSNNDNSRINNKDIGEEEEEEDDKEEVEFGSEEYNRKLAAIISYISHTISPNRSLSSGNLDVTEKKANIHSRQYINGAPAYAPHLQRKPVYSQQSLAMMEKMLQKPLDNSTRLGANSSGISAPVSLSANSSMMGLGYTGGRSNSNSLHHADDDVKKKNPSHHSHERFREEKFRPREGYQRNYNDRPRSQPRKRNRNE